MPPRAPGPHPRCWQRRLADLGTQSLGRDTRGETDVLRWRYVVIRKAWRLLIPAVLGLLIHFTSSPARLRGTAGGTWPTWPAASDGRGRCVRRPPGGKASGGGAQLRPCDRRCWQREYAAC